MVLNAKRKKLEDTTDDEQETEGAGRDEADDGTPQLESWPDFLRRAARWSEEQLDKAGLKEWLQLWRERQWTWAGNLMAGGFRKWSEFATKWDPLLHSGCRLGRPQARPRKRWSDDYVTFLESHLDEKRCWSDVAADKNLWASLRDDYVKFWSQ